MGFRHDEATTGMPADDLATAWYGNQPTLHTIRRRAPTQASAIGADSASSLPSLATGSILAGRYRIDQPIGSGAFASVHSAWDMTLHRWIAVKTYDMGASGAVAVDEARLQAACQHPNIMPLYDTGSDPLLGVTYLVMPLYPGADLRAVLDTYGPMPFRTAILCVDQICSALDFLWQRRQAVHADIKPANIWLTNSGAALLMDFNVYGILVRSSGGRVGTPGYTAPEALNGQLDPRSDVFSLGCVLYQCLTGVPPFADDRSVASGRFTPVRRLRAEIRPGLASVIETAIQSKPGKRYQSAREFRGALRSPTTGFTVWSRLWFYTMRSLRVIPFAVRCAWRLFRFAVRRPLEALIAAAVTLYLASRILFIVSSWVTANEKTIRVSAVVAVCILVFALIYSSRRSWRWRR